MKTNARELAHQSLLASFRDKKYANLENDAAMKKFGLSGADRAFFSALYFGVIEKKITIDYILSHFSTAPLHKMEPMVKIILECGVYQILWMDRVPERAAVFEAGELAKKYSRGGGTLVNGVLRRIAAEKDSIPALLDIPGRKGLAVKNGYQRWMVSLWQDNYGAEKCEEILHAQNGRAGITLRINTLLLSPEEYGEQLRDAGIGFHRNPLCINGLTLEKSVHPSLLPGFEEGLFFVQDAAAQRASDMLCANENECIVDVCASPGGKSFSAAMDMKNTGTITCFDLYPARLGTIESGARRLGLSHITVEAHDSASPCPDLVGKADRVICDVPCSGYGVIAKKPDIRHKSKEDAEKLPALQSAILESAAAYLKPGGRIVYSTCTLDKRENENITNAFLASHPAFSRRGEAETVFPLAGENDGFFIDVLERTK